MVTDEYIGGRDFFKAFSCHLRPELLFFPVKKKKSLMSAVICNTYFVVPSAKWLQAMGVSRRQGDILNRSWESLPTETSTLYGCGERSSHLFDVLVPFWYFNYFILNLYMLVEFTLLGENIGM